MNAETCAVLTAVFPVVMLTVAVERRTISINIRRMKFFRRSSLLALVGSLVGLGMTVVGVQTSGLTTVAAFIAWIVAGTSLVSLAVTLLGVMATAEVEEDRESVVAPQA